MIAVVPSKEILLKKKKGTSPQFRGPSLGIFTLTPLFDLIDNLWPSAPWWCSRVVFFGGSLSCLYLVLGVSTEAKQEEDRVTKTEGKFPE